MTANHDADEQARINAATAGQPVTQFERTGEALAFLRTRTWWPDGRYAETTLRWDMIPDAYAPWVQPLAENPTPGRRVEYVGLEHELEFGGPGG